MKTLYLKLMLNNHEDKPDWMGHVDFTDLKIKLISSIVAISGIHLLKIFLNLDKYSKDNYYFICCCAPNVRC